jgi:aminoglycoside phosphotransferase
MWVERITEGGSTYVYRLRTENERFYLRVLPEEGVSFLPEVEVHRRLRENGVAVPEVVYFEANNEWVQRSIMVTTEIPGTPISSPLISPRTS